MFGFTASWDLRYVLHLQPLQGITPMEVVETVYLGRGLFSMAMLRIDPKKI